MKKYLLLLLFIPLMSFGQLSKKKFDKVKSKTTYSSEKIVDKSSVFIGEFRTKNRPFDKSNISSHIEKNLIDINFIPTTNIDNADYVIEANYVTDLVAKKQILGLWLTMNDSKGNTVLSWQFERKAGGIILKPDEIGEFFKYIVKQNLGDEKPPSNINKPKNKILEASKDKAIEELKKLKELLDLELITKEEFDKRAKELKKIILNN
jgi:fibronectin type 3 domain-containing protein